MTRDLETTRKFNDGVLTEFAEAHRKTLKKFGAKEPTDAESLGDWAARAVKAYARRQRNMRKRDVYVKLFRSAHTLREIRTVLAMVGDDAEGNDLVYRLLFVCGDTDEALVDRFTGGGALASRRKARQNRTEKYWTNFLPLVEVAQVIKAEERFRDMKRPATAVAQETIKRLSPAQYKTLTGTEVRNPKEESWVVRQFSRLLRAAFGEQQNEDDALEPIDLVQWQVLAHRMRPVARYVAAKTPRAQRG